MMTIRAALAIYEYESLDKLTNLADLKKTRNELLLKYHPDRNVEHPEEQENNHKRTQYVLQAYTLLSPLVREPTTPEDTFNIVIPPNSLPEHHIILQKGYATYYRLFKEGQKRAQEKIKLKEMSK